jgi:hypothetical protein
MTPGRGQKPFQSGREGQVETRPPGSVALSNPCKTEVFPDDKLPRCDMLEEFDNPQRISEFVREYPMEDKDDEMDRVLRPPCSPP